MSTTEREIVPGIAVEDPSITQLVMALVTTIEFSSPAEIREAARAIDDLGNDPAISAKRRPLYRALSDVVKSWR